MLAWASHSGRPAYRPPSAKLETRHQERDRAHAPSGKLLGVTVGYAIRSAVVIGWLLNALLLERILTHGAITDISRVTQNPPLFVTAVGFLFVLSVPTVIAVVAGVPVWPRVSLAISVAYLVAGGWLRLGNGDDSGAAIVLTALVIAVLSLAAVSQWPREPGN